MKKKVFPLLLLIFVLIQACTKVQFEEPQPKGKRALKKIPSKFIGAYFWDQKDTVFVGENYYKVPEVIAEKIPLAALETTMSVRISGDLLFDDTSLQSEGTKYAIKNDTVYYSKEVYETTYMSDELIFKEESGYLVINVKDKLTGFWNVYLFEEASDGNLNIYAVGNFKAKYASDKIRYDGDLKEFYDITAFKEFGDNDYVTAPSNREFKKLVKAGFFKNLEVEIRKISDIE